MGNPKEMSDRCVGLILGLRPHLDALTPAERHAIHRALADFAIAALGAFYESRVEGRWDPWRDWRNLVDDWTHRSYIQGMSFEDRYRGQNTDFEILRLALSALADRYPCPTVPETREIADCQDPTKE